MQNTYQEKSLDPIDKDFLSGKKLEGGIKLSTVSDFKPAGDQPGAIKKLISGIKEKKNDQVLLGVTGSGKTFSMAKIIETLNRPALILAPNKTLAAQLYGEMKIFFLIMLWNILYLIMIIILQKHMCRDLTLILKKKHPLMNK